MKLIGSVVKERFDAFKLQTILVNKRIRKGKLKLLFIDSSLTELKILPHEKERARVEYIGIE